jgi:hypothetical protein
MNDGDMESLDRFHPNRLGISHTLMTRGAGCGPRFALVMVRKRLPHRGPHPANFGHNLGRSVRCATLPCLWRDRLIVTEKSEDGSRARW